MRYSGGALLTATSLFVNSVAGAVDPIVIKGAKFFNQNDGSQFFIKGIAYQQDFTGTVAIAGASSKGYNDPLADPSGCKRDIPLLKRLDTNTIRVYAIDPTKNHDECMSAMADAGIYVIADLSAPGNLSINSDDPMWNDDLYARYASVVDVMAKYTNTLGFFAGNEVANAPNNTESAPFVKAAVRDMKAYIKQKKYRSIGVGYATNDNQYVREPLADFFNCGDQTDAIDFWGYNIYSWCGDSSYTKSGYNDRTQEFSSYSVPSFFAEYGCNQPPRLFTDVLALYGPQMSKVFSGGVVYEYFQATNDYGVVTVGANQQATTLAGFKTLSTQIAKVEPSGVKMADYNPSNKPKACPTSQEDFRAQPTPLPPTPNEELCSCMYSALNCAVKSSVSSSDYKKLFNTVCGLEPKACAGIERDAGKANYGAYSMCNSMQQLGWAFNLYYLSQNKQDTACNFGGAAYTKNAVVPGGCKALLQEAGGFGTNTVTSSPQGTGAGAAAGAASAASGSSSASASASTMNMPSPERGLLPMALVVALGIVSGVAALLL